MKLWHLKPNRDLTSVTRRLVGIIYIFILIVFTPFLFKTKTKEILEQESLLWLKIGRRKKEKRGKNRVVFQVRSEKPFLSLRV